MRYEWQDEESEARLYQPTSGSTYRDPTINRDCGRPQCVGQCGGNCTKRDCFVALWSELSLAEDV